MISDQKNAWRKGGRGGAGGGNGVGFLEEEEEEEREEEEEKEKEDALPVHNWRRQGVKQHLYEARERTCMEWRSGKALNTVAVV